MDSVFKALADPTRRDLLDVLFEQDGQPLSALEKRAAWSMTGGSANTPNPGSPR
jgi:hypothetical protein